MLWDRESQALHADCRIFRVLREHWRARASAAEGDFFVLDVADWVIAIAQSAEGFVMVRQFRFGAAQLSLEFPAGLVEQGEDPVTAAARELQEESGFIGLNGRILGCVNPNPALHRNRCFFVFFPQATATGEQNPDPHEAFTVECHPLSAIRRMALDGTIQHAIIHAALYFLTEAV